MGEQAVLDLSLEGLTCAGCVRRVEQALGKVPGVVSASVNLANSTARVAVAGGRTLLPELLAAVDKAGYHARPREDEAQPPAGQSPGWDRDLLAAIAALVLAAPLVVTMLPALWGQHAMLPAWLQFLLATPVQFVLGWRFYRAGVKAALAGAGSMDLLVALGTTAAWGLSTWLWLTAPAGAVPHLYYEASAVIVAFVLLGRWLESRARQRTLGAIRALMQLRPETARLWWNGTAQVVPLSRIAVGDRVEVLAGERVPTDGRVLEGRAAVDEALLTGEALPVEKQPGDEVTGGSVNRDGRLLVRATAVGAETLIGRILRLVETAQAAKPPVQRLVDRVAAIFVPAVLVAALATLAGWLLAGAGAEEAILKAVAVLVIACPCALGLATPAALMSGIGVGARHGILFRDPAALDRLRRVQVVAFDKTGTLTEGKPRVTDLQPLRPEVGEGELLRLAAALAAGSAHPLSQALAAHARAGEALLPPVEAFAEQAGRGVTGTVAGRRLGLGNARLAASLGVPWPDEAGVLAAAGKSVSLLLETAPDRRALGLIAFGDRPKAGARAAISTLAAKGIETVLITGDSRSAAEAVAGALGLARVEAEVLPEQKAAAIQGLKAAGKRVAMVGDGVNDAPALAAADVGLAIGGGSAVALETAEVTLTGGDPRRVADAIALARRIHRTVWQNLGWAFAYNLVGLPLAAFGLLSPLLAGAAMALSSLSVVANALRLQRWHPGTEER